MISKSLNPIKIGVTGGIGSGKTFICKQLELLDYPVFYSDQEAKRLMNENREVVTGIIELLGSLAYENGELNRIYIAEKVFKEAHLLPQINELVHPAVRQAFDNFVQENSSSKMVFNEAAILFETGAYKNFDFNILITAPKALRIKRVAKRDAISKSEIQARMKNQWSDKQKIALADFVLVNDGSKIDMSLKEILEKIINTEVKSD